MATKKKTTRKKAGTIKAKPQKIECPEDIPIVDESVENVASNWPVIDHAPAKCPSCTSYRSKITTTRKPSRTTIMRWHKCTNCGTKYSSIQTLTYPDFNTEDVCIQSTV